MRYFKLQKGVQAYENAKTNSVGAITTPNQTKLKSED